MWGVGGYQGRVYMSGNDGYFLTCGVSMCVTLSVE